MSGSRCDLADPCPRSPLDALHERRNAIMARLESEGVSTRQGSHAPVLLGYYARKYGLTRNAFPGATLADRLSLTLPVYAGPSVSRPVLSTR